MKILSCFLFLLIITPSVLSADQNCIIFLNDKQISDTYRLETADYFEKAIVKISNFYSSKPEKSKEILEVVTALTDAIEYVLEAKIGSNDIRLLGYLSIAEKVFSDSIFLIESNMQPPVDNLAVEYLPQNRDLVKSETDYTVNLSDGGSLLVRFSQILIDQVFQGKIQDRVLSRSLQKISKGVFGSGYAGDGIIRLVRDSTILEVRASGKDGNFRMFGYFDASRVLNIVHYSISSDHGASFMARNANQVINIRNGRGH